MWERFSAIGELCALWPLHRMCPSLNLEATADINGTMTWERCQILQVKGTKKHKLFWGGSYIKIQIGQIRFLNFSLNTNRVMTSDLWSLVFISLWIYFLIFPLCVCIQMFTQCCLAGSSSGILEACKLWMKAEVKWINVKRIKMRLVSGQHIKNDVKELFRVRSGHRSRSEGKLFVFACVLLTSPDSRYLLHRLELALVLKRTCRGREGKHTRGWRRSQATFTPASCLVIVVTDLILGLINSCSFSADMHWKSQYQS